VSLAAKGLVFYSALSHITTRALFALLIVLFISATTKKLDKDLHWDIDSLSKADENSQYFVALELQTVAVVFKITC
jgi:hypothetical protein